MKAREKEMENEARKPKEMGKARRVDERETIERVATTEREE